MLKKPLIKKNNIFILFLLSFFLTACSGNSEQAVKYASLIPVENIQSTLTNGGWNLQSSESLNYNPFGTTATQDVLIAKKSSDELLFIGQFASNERAQEAYDEFIPEGESETIESDSGNYEQSVLELDNGFWIMSQVGDHVLGYYNQNSGKLESGLSFVESLIEK